MDDRWSVGTAYDTYMGRWSRLVAGKFIAWLGAPAGARWVDVGCGTGALTAAILDLASPGSVTGCDPSEQFIIRARARLSDRRAAFIVGSVENLFARSGTADLVVSGLVLNFIPDPAAAVNAMRRLLRPGGMVAVYVWDYRDGIEFLRLFWDEAVRLDPAAAEQDERERFGDWQPSYLKGLFSSAGLQEVRQGALEVTTRFQGFGDYWTPFLWGTGPAPAYAASLPDAKRDALRQRLSERLRAAGDGSIDLEARAWVISGKAAGG